MTNEQIQVLRDKYGVPPVLLCDMCGHDAWLDDEEHLSYSCDYGHSFSTRCSGDPDVIALLAAWEADKALIEIYREAYAEAQHMVWVNWEAAASMNVENEESKRRITELEEAASQKFLPVGVMSQSKFENLDDGSARFIALWPRPGVAVRRKRPDDGILVYAKVVGIST